MIASATSAWSSETVSTSTWLAGATVPSCQVASIPEIPGIFRSITTTSGCLLGDQLHPGLAVGRLTDQLDPASLAAREQLAQLGADDLAVVDHDHAQLVRVSFTTD